MRNKILILLGILTFSCSIFGQYTENKLPSGLTESTTVGDNDYTIIQKNGESIVKAVRMDTTASYIKQYIVDGISVGDGNLMITDGVNILKTSDISYDNTTYGGVLTIGTGINASYTAYNLNVSAPLQPNTVGSAYSITLGADNLNYGLSCLVAGQSNTLTVQDGFNLSYLLGAGNYNNSKDCNLFGTGLYSNGYRETIFGSYNDSIVGADPDSWIATDRLFTIANGSGGGTRSNALMMLKNGNTTVTGDWTIDGDLTVTGTTNTADIPHMFAYFGDLTEVFTISAIDTWYHLTNATGDLWTYQELDDFTVSNDTLTFENAGDYNVDFHLSFIGGNQDVYAIRFYNVTQAAGIPTAVGQTGQGALDVVSVTIASYAEIDAGDEVVLQMKCDDTEDATLKNSTIRIQFIHE